MSVVPVTVKDAESIIPFGRTVSAAVIRPSPMSSGGFGGRIPLVSEWAFGQRSGGTLVKTLSLILSHSLGESSGGSGVDSASSSFVRLVARTVDLSRAVTIVSASRRVTNMACVFPTLSATVITTPVESDSFTAGCKAMVFSNSLGARTASADHTDRVQLLREPGSRSELTINCPVLPLVATLTRRVDETSTRMKSSPIEMESARRQLIGL